MMIQSGMDRPHLAGLLGLLSLLPCGCNDPGFALRRAAHDGNVVIVEKILKTHPELVDDREKPMPVLAVAPGVPRGSTEWVNKLFTAQEQEFWVNNRAGLTPL